jgi:hypothetical protein
MRNKTLRMIAISQTGIFLLFLSLTFGNEIVDIPHYIFGDAPTSYSQRLGEIGIELSIFIIVMAIQVVLFKILYQRIRILEGIIPICANCKKIRNEQDQWQHMETYIAEHSHSEFSHGMCPECARELYPEFYKGKT